MENLLQGISGVCAYVNDVLITGASETEHLNNLARVLKKEKYAFLLPSVSYLGHVISAEDLHTERTKVRAVVEAPEPQNVGELRSFLGMVTYYGKFLPDLRSYDSITTLPAAPKRYSMEMEKEAEKSPSTHQRPAAFRQGAYSL